MNSQPIPEVHPVGRPTRESARSRDDQDDYPDVSLPPRRSRPLRVERKGPNPLFRVLGSILLWPFVALFAMSYVSSLVLVGWGYRWMRKIVLRSWWKQGRPERYQTFEEFAATLEKHPVEVRPKLFSLFRNLGLGIQAIFCTYLVAGLGCALMAYGWEFGWVNSFHKGYEFYFVGILTSLAGMVLFTLSMFHVGLAQVHHAVTGKRYAFFDFHFVWQLVKSRLFAYLGFATLVSLFYVLGQIPKVVVLGPEFVQQDELSNRALFWRLTSFYYLMSLLFVPSYLIVRWLAAKMYAGAVVAALKAGRLTREDLHPVLVDWLEKTKAMPEGTQGSHVVVRGVKKLWRIGLYVAVFLILFASIFPVRYTGEFLVYHPIFGFANFEYFQFPCFNFTPFNLLYHTIQDPDGVNWIA